MYDFTDHRHFTQRELYRTILLEEGCDLEAPRRERPAPATFGYSAPPYAVDGVGWMPRLRLWFGES